MLVREKAESASPKQNITIHKMRRSMVMMADISSPQLDLRHTEFPDRNVTFALSSSTGKQWLIIFNLSRVISVESIFVHLKSWNSHRTLSRCQSPMSCNNGSSTNINSRPTRRELLKMRLQNSYICWLQQKEKKENYETHCGRPFIAVFTTTVWSVIRW